MRALGTSFVAVAVGFVAAATASVARAQTGAPASYGAPPSYGTQPPYITQPTASSQAATDLEIGTLYAFSAGYGVGVGAWFDAELSIDDPGLKFMAPAILGVAAPVGVFFLDRPRMPRGMPAAIATGMAIGAGEGAGIASTQFVRSSAADAWGFRGFARSVFIGSTAGTIGGYLTAVTMEPSPKTSLLLGSTVVWGTVVGSMFGYGASKAGSDFGDANDSAALSGFIGYNVGLVGAAALSMVWVPTYQSLTWMWIGFGAGAGVSLPVFLFYAGGDHDARRGLIFMGTAATLGLVAGAVFTVDSKDFGQSSGPGHIADRHSPVELTGGGLMPVPGGMGFQLSGLLF